MELVKLILLACAIFFTGQTIAALKDKDESYFTGLIFTSILWANYFTFFT